MTYNDYVRRIAFDVHYALRTPDGDPDDRDIIFPDIRARLTDGSGIEYEWNKDELVQDIASIVYYLVGE